MESLHEFPYIFEYIIEHLDAAQASRIREVCKAWDAQYFSSRRRVQYLLQKLADSGRKKSAAARVILLSDLSESQIAEMFGQTYPEVVRDAIQSCPMSYKTVTEVVRRVSTEALHTACESMGLCFSSVFAAEELCRRREIPRNFPICTVPYSCDREHDDHFVNALRDSGVLQRFAFYPKTMCAQCLADLRALPCPVKTN